MYKTTESGAVYGIGDYLSDGRAEAQIIEFSPDGVMVTIEYTDTEERATIAQDRVVEQNDELRVV
jgi:hypothetical protein